jgi:hypothetical protein
VLVWFGLRSGRLGWVRLGWFKFSLGKIRCYVWNRRGIEGPGCGRGGTDRVPVGIRDDGFQGKGNCRGKPQCGSPRWLGQDPVSGGGLKQRNLVIWGAGANECGEAVREPYGREPTVGEEPLCG